jgi:hypothetical protein
MDGRGPIPGRCKIFFSFIPSRPALWPTQPSIRRVSGAVSPGVKQQEREADRSSPSSAEVKNGGALPSLLHVPLWHNA